MRSVKISNGVRRLRIFRCFPAGQIAALMLLHTPRLRAGSFEGVTIMGRSILLLLLGVPIPVIILIALFFH